MAIYDLSFGTLTTGPFRDGCWRDDTYTPYRTASHDAMSEHARAYELRPKIEAAMAAGPDDDSNRHNAMTYAGGKYDAECSCCWLGISHTERKHARCVGKDTDK